MDVCPITHIPLPEIKNPVYIPAITARLMIIYDAVHMVHWLKHHSLLDPVTHNRIAPGFACDILRPTLAAGPETLLFSVRDGLFSVRDGYLNGKAQR